MGNGYIYSGGSNILYQYTFGDGNDTILDYVSGDKISLTGETYTTETVGNNVVVSVFGSGTITLVDAKDKTVSVVGGKIFSQTDGDSISNRESNHTITGGSGNDTIENYGTGVLINSGAGDDSIKNRWSAVTINAGEGNDTIYNVGYTSSINGATTTLVIILKTMLPSMAA